MQGPSGDVALGSGPPDESFSWRLRRDGQGLHRLKSQPASVTSAEEDMVGQDEVDIPIQRMQKENVKTL